jgi:hypothetical protein
MSVITWLAEGTMAVSVEMHNTGDPALRAEVATTIEHVLSQRSGDWRVLIVGSQANDRWEMRKANRKHSQLPCQISTEKR